MRVGTWDDHDYGVNDGDSSYVDKRESQRLLLDFLDEHRDSPRHHRDGVYNAWCDLARIASALCGKDP